jgi:hypothetical protein
VELSRSRAENRQRLPSSPPCFIEPAPATALDEVPKGDRWIRQIKFHGFTRRGTQI